MVDESVTSLAFMVLALFAFAWTVRLGFQVKKHIRDHSTHLHDRIDELEESAQELRRDMNSLSSELDRKIDSDDLEKRISGLVELVRGK